MKTVKSLMLSALVLATVLAVGVARADGFRNPPESASAIGRIGGKIAHADDASAATVNPANMSELERPAYMLSLTAGYGVREFSSPMGASEESQDPWSYLPAAFGVMPLQDGFAFGLGVTVPYGRFTDWGEDVVFGATSPYYALQSVIAVNPALSWKASDALSVAAGVSYYDSRMQFKQIVPWSMFTGVAATPAGKADFDSDGNGFGANAAMTWKLNDRHTLALTYRAPFDIEYDGTAEVTELPAALRAMGVTDSEDFETEVSYPTIVQAGYGVKLGDAVRVEFDVEWVESSRNESLPVEAGLYNQVLGLSEIPQDWEDNWTYGMGMDWAFAPEWTLRTGLIYLETPTLTSTTVPVASEEDQAVVSLGLGYAAGAHKVDVAYAVGIFDGLTVDDNVNPYVNGEYDFQSHLVSVGYQYSF
jgi:long-chain fatty acid transport protein